MENNNVKLTLTGSEAKKLVSKEAKKYGVHLNVYTSVPNVIRTEAGGTGDPMDDTYGGEFHGSPIVNITWNQFLEICKKADDFSALKQKRFEEVGVHDSSSEHGTGINISIRRSDYGGKSGVYVG